MFEKEFETKYYKLVFMNKKNKIKFIFNTFIIILSFLNYIISFIFMLYVMIVLRDVFYASIVLLVYFLLDISLNGLWYGIFPTIKNIMIYQFHNEYLKSKYFVLYGIYNEDTKFYKEMREKLSKEVKKEMYLYNFFEEENTEVKEKVLKKELKYKKWPFITTNIFIKIHSNLRNLFIFLMPVLVFITYFL